MACSKQLRTSGALLKRPGSRTDPRDHAAGSLPATSQAVALCMNRGELREIVGIGSRSTVKSIADVSADAINDWLLSLDSR